jgi:predicted nucleotidyltransferase
MQADPARTMHDSDALDPSLINVQAVLQSQPSLVFSALIGSRAKGSPRADSDWDIALHWAPGQDLWDLLAKTETLRRSIAQTLQVAESAVDLIDLHRANLAMRASVAEEGLPLSGESTLEWSRFLTRTWRELEDFYWDQQHAA